MDEIISGDGKDEEVAAKQMNFPFWRISSHSDLVAFYNALDMGFMQKSFVCELTLRGEMKPGTIRESKQEE